MPVRRTRVNVRDGRKCAVVRTRGVIVARIGANPEPCDQLLGHQGSNAASRPKHTGLLVWAAVTRLIAVGTDRHVGHRDLRSGWRRLSPSLTPGCYTCGFARTAERLSMFPDMAQPPTSVVLSTEMLKSALTVAGGVLIFVLGQVVQRLLIEPIHEQRKTIGEIAYALLMYGNVGQVAEIQAKDIPVVEPTPPLEVVKTVRALAARLQQSRQTIPMYPVLALVRAVPSTANLLEAIKWLTAWSNSIYTGQPMSAQDKVAKALRIIRNPSSCGRHVPGLNNRLHPEKAVQPITVWLRFESRISRKRGQSCQRFARTTASLVNLSSVEPCYRLGAVVGSIPTAGSR